MSVLVRKEVWRKSQGETQKIRWFQDKLSNEDAATILREKGDRNTYVVYHHPSNNAFVLALRLPNDDNVRFFDLLCIDGRYKVEGQTQDYDDVIKAAHDFAASFSAPLTPKLDPAPDVGLQASEPTVRSPGESTVSFTCSFPESPPHRYQGSTKAGDGPVGTCNGADKKKIEVSPSLSRANVNVPVENSSSNRDLKDCTSTSQSYSEQSVPRSRPDNSADQSSDCRCCCQISPGSRDSRHRILCVTCIMCGFCLSGHEKE